MRLLTMRSQLEQLQYRQQAARQRQSQVFELITALEPLLGVAAPAGGAPGMIGSDQLIADIIQAQEKERLRISLQMHDGPAQSMSNLVLRAEICQRLLTAMSRWRALSLALSNMPLMPPSRTRAASSSISAP